MRLSKIKCHWVNYIYRTGDGLDTIQDSDGGKLYMDDVQLAVGAVYGDSRVHRSTAIGAVANDNAYHERKVA